MSGDQVLVSPGTYFEAINLGGETIQLTGVSGAAATIIDAAGQGKPVVHVPSGSNTGTVIEGFTLCHGSGLAPSKNGGGLYATGSILEVRNCNISQNAVTGVGGGAYQATSGSVKWVNCNFEENQAVQYGGGLYVTTSTGTTFLTGCTFTENSAVLTTGFAYGGGVYAARKTVMSECVFTGNASVGSGQSQHFGSAVQLVNASPSTMSGCTFNDQVGNAVATSGTSLTLAECLFEANMGTFYAGGLYSTTGTITMTDCTFTQNTGVQGSAVNINSGAAVLATNCQFIANEGYYAAVLLAGGGPESRIFNSCTFTGNSGTASGAMVCGSDASLIDCTITDNVSVLIGGGLWITSGRYSNSTICNNEPSNIDGAWVDLGGNDYCGDLLGDINNDGLVDGADLGKLLAQWDTFGPESDLNNDFHVDGTDLGLLLGSWTG